jgi:RNA polymerase sigma factor (sigma-70 family)
MPQLRISWKTDSPFFRWARAEARRETGNDTEADDVLSQLWWGLERLGYEEGHTVDVCLLITIIKRKAWNFLRNRARKRAPAAIDAAERAISREKSPDALVVQLEENQRVQSALQKLPLRQSQALRARYGLPGALETNKLAQEFGVTRKAVERLARKGLEPLARLLAGRT